MKSFSLEPERLELEGAAVARDIREQDEHTLLVTSSRHEPKVGKGNGALTLDVGCGPYKLPGAFGVDRRNWNEVDVVCDLNLYPWPFQTNSFDRVVCRHVLTHLDSVILAMEEFHRIIRPGGRLEVVVPHFSSDNAFTDITTRCFFGYRSMDFFCIDRKLKYRYSSTDFRLLEWRISFRQAHQFEDQNRKFNPFKAVGLEQLINAAPRIYEHFFAFVLRANEVYFCLEVLK